MYTRLLEPDQISYTQSMVAKRGRTNRANVHTPMLKSCLKHSAADFQVIWAAISHYFIANNKTNSEATCAATRNLRLFLGLF